MQTNCNYETWLNIPGYDGIYIISNLGNVKSRSLNHNKSGLEKELHPIHGNHGYLYITLHKNGIRKNHLIHRVVLSTFIGESKLFCNHKNGNKQDNRLENLEWVTHRENILHAFNTGLQKSGSKHRFAKLTDSQAHRIKTIKRNCGVERGYWTKIAKSLCVGLPTISQITRGFSWKRLK